MAGRITDAVVIKGHGEMAGNTAATAFTSVRGAWAKFKAPIDNAGNVCIGITSSLTRPAGTTTATAGWDLDAGQETDWLPIPSGDLANFYYRSQNAGDDILYFCIS